MGAVAVVIVIFTGAAVVMPSIAVCAARMRKGGGGKTKKKQRYDEGFAAQGNSPQYKEKCIKISYSKQENRTRERMFAFRKTKGGEHMKAKYRQWIKELVDRVNDESVLRRVWKILERTIVGK